jgi:hypothetical protein
VESDRKSNQKPCQSQGWAPNLSIYNDLGPLATGTWRKGGPSDTEPGPATPGAVGPQEGGAYFLSRTQTQGLGLIPSTGNELALEIPALSDLLCDTGLELEVEVQTW